VSKAATMDMKVGSFTVVGFLCSDFTRTGTLAAKYRLKKLACLIVVERENKCFHQMGYGLNIVSLLSHEISILLYVGICDIRQTLLMVVCCQIMLHF